MDDWEPGHPDPDTRRGPSFKKKNFLGPIGPQFRLKVRRGGSRVPRAPPLDPPLRCYLVEEISSPQTRLFDVTRLKYFQPEKGIALMRYDTPKPPDNIDLY